MLANAFIGLAHEPTQAELRKALGPSLPVWRQLLAALAEQLNLTTQEWNSYSPKAGWALRVKHKKRNIVYLQPVEGGVRASFILGEKALTVLRDVKLPPRIRKAVDTGQKYPEGTAVRIELVRDEEIAAVANIAAVKMKN